MPPPPTVTLLTRVCRLVRRARTHSLRDTYLVSFNQPELADMSPRIICPPFHAPCLLALSKRMPRLEVDCPCMRRRYGGTETRLQRRVETRETSESVQQPARPTVAHSARASALLSHSSAMAHAELSELLRLVRGHPHCRAHGGGATQGQWGVHGARGREKGRDSRTWRLAGCALL